MLNDSSKDIAAAPKRTLVSSEVPQKQRPSRWLLLGLPLWVLASFIIGQLLVVALVWIIEQVGVSLLNVDSTILNTSVAALSYGFSLLVVLGAPWLIRRRKTTLQTMGLHRLVRFTDIIAAPVAAIVYLFISGLLVYIVTLLAPGFDMTQAQEVGFGELTYRYEYILAFITLVVLAPVAEELLFRGYLYGKLRQITSSWGAIIIVSILFAALHLPATQLQWNVAVDVFALSVVLSFLREKTGSVWASILLHMMKNGLAFYVLFINPDLLRILGG